MGGANLASGPLSVAIEFALQLVDFHNPTVRLVAWIVAGLLTLAGLASHVFGKLGGSSLQRALARADELAKEMLGYVRTRDATAPSSSPSGRGAFSRFSNRGLGGLDRKSHDAETMAIWTGRFAKGLSSVLAKLHQLDLIDQAEMQTLLHPRSPQEVRDVAFRLVDLASQEIVRPTAPGCLWRRLA